MKAPRKRITATRDYWDRSAWQTIFSLGDIRVFQLGDVPRERRQWMVRGDPGLLDDVM